jgi:hypothetical protein
MARGRRAAQTILGEMAPARECFFAGHFSLAIAMVVAELGPD